MDFARSKLFYPEYFVDEMGFDSVGSGADRLCVS